MSILLALNLTSALISQNDSKADRIKALEPYFDPPFSQMIKIHPKEQSRLAIRKDPLNSRGFITVSPPKGQCFAITRAKDSPEKFICKKTQLAFFLRDINAQGQVVWNISTGRDDFGTDIVWETPYRIAQILKPGELLTGLSTPVILTSCKTIETKFARKIILTTSKNKKWTISLPPTDILMPQPDPPPNLYFTMGGKRKNIFKKGAKATASEKAKKAKQDQKKKAGADGKEPPVQPLEQKKKEAAKQTTFSSIFGGGGKKKKKDKFYIWKLTNKNSYEMNSSNFSLYGAPGGKEGTCRYRFKGGPHESDIGIIECIHTDGLDGVLAPLTCINEFKPRYRARVPKVNQPE